MQRAALAVAERAGKLDNAILPGREKLLAGKLGRGAQVTLLPSPRRCSLLGGEGVNMGLVAGRDHQHGGLDFNKAASGKKLAQSRSDPRSGEQEGAALCVGCKQRWHQQSRGRASLSPGTCAEIAGECSQDGYGAARLVSPWRLFSLPFNRGIPTVKVIASSLRKGNIVEFEGKLYVVLNAESFHPGKGTPTTQVDMRRISDGVKVAQRFKTTEQVERAYVEDREHQYLYQDGDGFHFMNTETYDQVTLPADIIGEQAAYLQPEMKVTLSVHEGLPVSIQLPQKAILEVVDTEPTVKGQTAASSYKPAVLSNGVRTMVPPFVGTGTKIVVMTADGSYVERAKD